MKRSLAAWLRSRRPVWIVGVVGVAWSLGWGVAYLLTRQWSGAAINGVIAVAYFALLEWDRHMARRRRRWLTYEDLLVARAQAYQDSSPARKEHARTLLLSVLTPHQRSVYEQEGYIPVCGSRGGEYRIYPYKTSNVKVCHKGATACAVTRGGSSLVEEQMLAQYLALVTDERAFLRVAILSFDRSIRY